MVDGLAGDVRPVRSPASGEAPGRAEGQPDDEAPPIRPPGWRVALRRVDRWLVASAVAVAAVTIVPLALAWSSGRLRSLAAGLESKIVILLYLAVGGAMVVAVVAGRAAGVVRGVRWTAPAGIRRWAAPAGLAASMLAFTAPAFAAWHHGRWWAMVGGAVPFSDAHLYFGGAERLLLFGDLDTYNSRRPLNAMFLALRLGVTHLDLRLALLLGGLAAGAACWLAARAVGRDLGVAAGLALFAGAYGFSRVYVPTPMTEVLGVTFGALAFATLWHAVRDRHRGLAVAGVFLLTVALDARSGVLLLPFVLPFWLARHLRREGRGRLDWRFLAAAGVAVVLGAGVNYGSVAALGGDTGNTLGNGGFVVYGLATGHPSWDVLNPSWAQIFTDHPEIVNMTDEERNSFINDKAGEEIRHHPGRFIWASVLSERNYLVLSKRLVMEPVPLSRQRPAMAVAAAALAVALVVRIRRRSKEGLVLDLGLLASMVLAIPVIVSAVPGSSPPSWLAPAIAALAFLGFVVAGTHRLHVRPQIITTLVVFGSMALFLPLLGADTVRVFAATSIFAMVPLCLAVAALVAAATARRAPAPEPAPPVVADVESADGRRSTFAPPVAAAALLAVIVLGAPVAMAVVDPPPLDDAPTCPDGRPADHLLGGVGVRIVVEAEAEAGGDRAPDEVGLASFARQAYDFTPVPSNHLQTITGPSTFMSGLTTAGGDRFALVEGQVEAPQGSILYLCGQVQHDPLTDLYFSYFPVPVDVYRGRPAP